MFDISIIDYKPMLKFLGWNDPLEIMLKKMLMYIKVSSCTMAPVLCDTDEYRCECHNLSCLIHAPAEMIFHELPQSYVIHFCMKLMLCYKSLRIHMQCYYPATPIIFGIGCNIKRCEIHILSLFTCTAQNWHHVA